MCIYRFSNQASRMRRYALFSFLCVLLFGCASKQDLEEAKERVAVLEDSLAEARKRIQKLENTPHERLARAGRLSGSEAESEYTALVEAYPQSEEAEIAKDSLEAISARREAARAARERRQRLGFKVLEETRDVKVGPTRVRFTSVRTGNRWTYDDYGDTYHYRDAQRGHTYVLADVRITADEDALNPDLAPVHVYKAGGESLVYIGTMRYEFRRWDDYGSYLGNDADYGNDFSRTSTIPFKLGLEVTDEDATGPLFVMVEKRNCASRQNNSYGSPEVSYSTYSCIPNSGLKRLSVEEAQTLHTIEVLNRENL
jgi:hypothetical protein